MGKPDFYRVARLDRAKVYARQKGGSDILSPWNRGWFAHRRGETCPDESAPQAMRDGWLCRADHFEHGSPHGFPLKNRPVFN